MGYPRYNPRETSCAARRRKDGRKARDGDSPVAEEHKATMGSRIPVGLWSSSPLNDSSQTRQTCDSMRMIWRPVRHLSLQSVRQGDLGSTSSV